MLMVTGCLHSFDLKGFLQQWAPGFLYIHHLATPVALQGCGKHLKVGSCPNYDKSVQCLFFSFSL